jgi:predicted molibdopterin-dependent oxidoreductase YjgC
MPDRPETEAARCLHCECLKPVSCLLRRYAEEYGARQTAFRLAERPDVEMTQRSDIVAFEPGKCIKCGICVEIGRQAGEPFGMSFVERGYSTRVRVPFARTLEEALKKSAQRSVAACPTSALAYRRGETSEP